MRGHRVLYMDRLGGFEQEGVRILQDQYGNYWNIIRALWLYFIGSTMKYCSLLFHSILTGSQVPFLPLVVHIQDPLHQPPLIHCVVIMTVILQK